MSDDETNINSLEHQRLLQAVTNLRKSQHINKPTRNEPQIEPDEFGLVKRHGGELDGKRHYASGAQIVKVNDIVEVLKSSDKHTKTKNLLTNVRKSKKVLERPLEKPAAERLKRQIGYENVKTKLRRWNAVVAKNRSSETQIFPLPSAETLFVDTSGFAKPLERSIKSELQLQLMETDAKLKRLRKERDGLPIVDEAAEKRLEEKFLEQKLTREELIAKRKELAYLKLRQSQLQSKARMQNKVKSKKYHKLLKRQKMKDQMKEFELLQKTNPEAAMEKLNAIERNRIYERASLKHKNTGTWAKNLQMRAKYDKSVRQDLAEQLQISRELTKKKNVDDDEDEEEEQENNVVAEEENIDETEVDPFNPWTRVKSKNNKENLEAAKDENDQSWRKYWLERNVNQKLLKEYEESKKAEKKVVKSEKKTKTKKSVVYENGWLVEELEEKEKPVAQNIDSIFDEGEERIRNRLEKKLKKMQTRAMKIKEKEKLAKGRSKKKLKNEENKSNKELKDLELKNQRKKKLVFDEELNADSLTKPKTVLDVSKESTKSEEKEKEKQEVDHIDVTKLANVRLQKNMRNLEHVDIDDCDVDLNEVDEDLQQININEAFEDDDIAADFQAEKVDETKLKNTELELSLPGWGSWAGAGISQEAVAARKAKMQQKRLILHLAEQNKRVDAKKPHVYINEEVSKDIREHLVSDVPFPFTRVKDFEASVRAPIGRTFVPETAFRMLIRPEIRVRKGQVIEPMDETELVKPARRLRHEVDKRLAVVQQEKASKKETKK